MAKKYNIRVELEIRKNIALLIRGKKGTTSSSDGPTDQG